MLFADRKELAGTATSVNGKKCGGCEKGETPEEGAKRRYPFSKERDPIDVILNDDIVPLGQRDKTIPKNLCVVLDKALEKKARDRHRTAGEMLAAVKIALP